MAISFRSASSAFAEMVPTVSVAKPAGVEPGDVLIAIHFATGASGDMTAPPGWVQAGTVGMQSGVSNGKIWYRVAGPDEGESYQFGMSGNASCTLFVQAFSGVDSVMPVNQVVWGGAAETTDEHVAPSVTPVGANYYLVCAWGATAAGPSRQYTPPAGMTEDGDVASGWSFGAVAHQALSSNQVTGTRTAVCSVPTAGYLSVSLLLTPAPLASVENNERELIWWIDPQGNTTLLGVSWGVTGRFMPPIEFEEDRIPGMHGAQVRNVRAGVREFTLPLWIGSDPITGAHFSSPAELRLGMRHLVSLMNPVWGPGTIKVQSPAGDTRMIRCYYAGGLEMDESLGDNTGWTAQQAAVLFRAYDPFWTDGTQTVVEYTTGEQPAFFPIFPVSLTSSEIFFSGNVENFGDIEAWPVWEFISPGTGILVRNMTTGKKLELNVSLSPGESITVDTRPGLKSVMKNDGTNLFNSLTNGSSFWPLVKGNNQIQVEMTGALDTSRVRLSYEARYLAP